MLRVLAALFLFVGSAFADQNVVILLGGPGSGKGTQAEVVRDELNLPHISTGDLIRQYLKEGPASDEKVKELKSFTESGKLVPDRLIMGILQERISKPDAAKGFILDGFPRTISQAEALNGMLKPGSHLSVIYFEVPDDMLIKRLVGRLTCPQCNTIYNSFYAPPKLEETCDECKSKLAKRADDNLETITKRLEVFHKETAPLIQYYTQKGLLKKIDSSKDKKEVSAQVMQLLKANAVQSR